MTFSFSPNTKYESPNSPARRGAGGRKQAGR